LIGNDPALALKCGADGVHFRRNTDFSIARTWRRRCPEWSLSIAGMKDDSYMQDKAYISGLKIFDAVFISSVFASQSPSAGRAEITRFGNCGSCNHFWASPKDDIKT